MPLILVGVYEFTPTGGLVINFSGPREVYVSWRSNPPISVELSNLLQVESCLALTTISFKLVKKTDHRMQKKKNYELDMLITVMEFP